MKALMEVRHLVVRFYTYEGVVRALEGISLELLPGETFGLVGETGSGKTVTALSILVLPPPPGRIEGGEIICFRDRGRPINLLEQRPEVLRDIRGKEIAMIFQEPSSALNPVYTVGDQIAEVLFEHRRQELGFRAEREMEELAKGQGWLAPLVRLGRRAERPLLRLAATPSLQGRLIGRLPLVSRSLKKQARRLTIELLRQMELADPNKVVDRYPHELSGGMKQRVMIAMAIACRPKLLIADEPTTALDVTIQAQILDLLRRLKTEWGVTILYITHNLGVVAELCDRVGVMYAGAIAEVAEVRELFRKPLHPYTQALLATIPRPQAPLRPISGEVPSLLHPPPGCRFHPRCPFAMEICPRQMPGLIEVRPGHKVACHLYPGPQGP